MEQETTAEKQPIKNKRKALIGLLLIAIGLVCGYFFIYLKIADMQQQEDIRYSMKAMLLTPFSIVFGIYYIFLPPTGSGAWKELAPKEKTVFIAFLVAAGLATFVTYYLFSLQLVKYGYEGIF